MLRFDFHQAFSIAAVALALCGCHSGGGDDDDDDGGGGGGTTTFTVGGNVTGLTQGSLVLRLNGANDLTLNSNASGTVPFTFTAAPLANGASYTVSIAGQPNTAALPVSFVCGPGVANGAGSINGANVTNVALACASYSVGGTVTGLQAGANLLLQLNGQDTKLHTVTANGPFTFPSSVALGIGVAHLIHIKEQPAGQTCLILGALGLIRAIDPNVTTAQVSCVDNVTDALSGTYQVTHVDSEPYVGRNLLTFYPDGTFLLGNHEVDSPDCGPSGQGALEYGVYNWDETSHDFRVVSLVKLAQPQECGLDETTEGKLVKRGDGSLLFADDEGTITFTPVPSTAGELTGSWGDNQTFTAYFDDGTFFNADTRAFAPAQVAGTSPGIEDGCYTLSGTSRVSGAFTTNVTGGCAVGTQTAVDTTGFVGLSQFATQARTFSVTGDTLQATLGANAPALVLAPRILVAPEEPSAFSVSGTITGLTGTTGVTLRLNSQTGASFNAFRPAGATTFAFDARLESGAAFIVGVPAHVQPTSPKQFCRPTSVGSGTIVASDVTDVVITCTNSAAYTVTGNVTGLAGGAQLALHARYFDVSLGTEGEVTSANVVVSANGLFNPVTIPANVPFFLGILTQPAGQACTLTRGTGFSLGPPSGPNISNVDVVCANNVTGPLSGTYSLLDGEGRGYINFNADGTLTTVLIHRDPDPANQAPPADCAFGVPAIDQRNGNGVEYGVFSWNQTTGATQLLANPAVDTNGDCGFWSNDAPPNPWGIITRANDTLVLQSAPGDLDPFMATATAVDSVPGSLVGAWVPEANNGILLVFHADGTFMSAETQLAFLFPAGYGQERGCYTVSDPDSTITMTVAATCRPDGLAAYDLNGVGGAFANASVISMTGPVPFRLVDANTLDFIGRIFKRTQPN